MLPVNETWLDAGEENTVINPPFLQDEKWKARNKRNKKKKIIKPRGVYKFKLWKYTARTSGFLWSQDPRNKLLMKWAVEIWTPERASLTRRPFGEGWRDKERKKKKAKAEIHTS